MANQYELQLKATLDTSEVKRKLEDLRKVQQNALGGQGGNQKAGLNGVGNLQHLQSTLERLNQTMLSLQRLISQGIANNRSQTNNSTTPFIPIGGGGIPSKSKEVEQYKSGLRQIVKDLVVTNPEYLSGRNQFKPYNWYEGIKKPIKRKPWNHVTAAINETYTFFKDKEWQQPVFVTHWGSNADYKKISSQYPHGYPSRTDIASAYFGQSLQRGFGENGANLNKFNSMYGSGKMSPAVRWAGGFAAHQVMSGVGDYFQQTGNKTGSTLAGIGQTAAIGGMIGGAPGVVLGAAVGVLSEGFKELTNRVKTLNETLATQESRVKEAYGVKYNLQNELRESNDNRRLKIGDTKYFEEQLKSTKARLEQNKKFNRENIGDEPDALEKYEKETLKQLNIFKAGNPSGEIPEYIKKRQQIADQYKQNLQNIKILEGRASGYESTLEGFGIYQDEDKQDTMDYKKNIGRMESYRLKGIRNIITGELSDAQDKKKMMMERGFSLESIEKVQKEIDTFKERLGILNDEIGRRDEITKTSKKKALMEEIDNLQDQLASMKAPNMESVSSLASQGFMISEKDDEIRWKSQEKYLNEQTRLQREIKNKVMKLENSTEFQ